MKRRTSVFLVLITYSLLLFCAVSSFADAEDNRFVCEFDVSKKQGVDSVTARLYRIAGEEEKYHLEIEGYGYTVSYSKENSPPWCELYGDKIVTATVTASVEAVGDYLFYSLTELEMVSFYGLSTAFPISESTVFPSGTCLFGHFNSTVYEYAEYSDFAFLNICKFENSACEICNYRCDNHTGGAQTCEKGKLCEICGIEYTSPSEHTYHWYDGKAAACESAGVLAHYECLECGRCFDGSKVEIFDVSISSQGHSFGNLNARKEPTCTSDGNVAYYECGVCHSLFDENKNKTADIKIAANGHSGGTPTCVRGAICTKCSQPYGKINAENHSYMPKRDTAYHWHECECGMISDKATHSLAREIVKSPTETEKGSARYFCECGYSFDKEITLDDLNSTEINSPAKKSNGTIWFTVILITVITVALIAVAVLLFYKKIDFKSNKG